MRLKNKLVGTLFATLLLSFTYACSTTTDNQSDAKGLFWLKTADPNRDFTDAVAHGDLRFLALNGFAAGMILGTDQFGADADLIKAYGSRTIVGTSDTGNADLNELADTYARKYNALLVKYLRARASSPGH